MKLIPAEGITAGAGHRRLGYEEVQSCIVRRAGVAHGKHAGT